VIFNVKLLPHQFAFLTAKEKFVWLRAGLGAGKTYALAQWLINRMIENPETLGLVCAATYKQLNNSILTELFKQLDLMGLAYHFSTLTGIITLEVNGAQLLAFSLENYEILRGIEVGYIAIDEACLAKEDAYNVAIGRLRCRKSKALLCRIVSTPKGFDYLYERYVGERKDVHHRDIHATALDNPHLPDGYLDSLKNAYTTKMYAQEVLAEFVSNAEGNIYYAFDRSEHIRPIQQIPGARVHVGMDFNVNPMTAVLANVVGNSIYVFGEIYKPNFNTYQMAATLHERQPGDRIEIVPDATGKSRKTSSVQSDHQILRQAGFTVLTARSNPPVEDRYNTVNGLLYQSRIIVSPECPMLIRDLERVNHEHNPEYLTHISDALGYLAWNKFPLKKQRPESRVIQM
jgi:PBSX family phage terminase large subunit